VAQKRKKAVRKKVSRPAKKEDKLTAADVEHFKKLLMEKRREIINSVNEIKDEALNKSMLDASGDLSSMPIHMADLGTDNYEQEFALGLMDSERKLLQEIDEALLRIQDSSFGICEGTSELISKARLEAKPWAKYCVEYAQKLEKGLVAERPEEQGFKPTDAEDEEGENTGGPEEDSSSQ
jgi:RNA polymerase-binding protein DksA